jgi:uncharacterized protein YkwD
MLHNSLLKYTAIGLGVIVLPVLAGAAFGKLTETVQPVKPFELVTLAASQTEPHQEPPSSPEIIATESPASATPDPAPLNQQVAGASTPAAKPSAPAAPTCSGAMAQQFICLLNDYRAQHGLGKVALSSALSVVAQDHSIWMNQTGTFSHTGINGSRLTERCNAANTTCLAENLAHKISSPEQLLDSWKANTGHNQNLLGPYSSIGYGAAGSYITLLFR